MRITSSYMTLIAVMTSVVDAQRDILLDPTGTNVWSGQVPQSLNSAAVTYVGLIIVAYPIFSYRS